ncbi:hypothetical protein GCM10009678_56360 [Actinomadura kijaniata]|uniref:Secreted protein n=1 Tax=Actinomadura namibiensis TaxID=182080 RepID=A0A7W3QMW4_ACTNM|nr:hypothetical protein [Actinomadura namibiensis]MBA8953007.1 hypothetical protein [Actinomadura namibiensis]
MSTTSTPRIRAARARRVAVATAALVAAAAFGAAAPAQARVEQGRLYVWVSDGWGGGTVTSNPAGINCHQEAWDPYADSSGNTPQQTSAGTCDANFPVGTTVTLTATPDPGSYVNVGPDPNPVTIRSGYNSSYVVFCPNDGLCSSW